MSYNPSIGTPNRRPVSTYSGAESRDLPKSYAEAREACERASKRRGGARGKVAHNTTIREVPCDDEQGRPAYAVKLHDTDIVVFLPCGSVELSTGGYQTFTTRDRMNRCGVRIGMADGVPAVYHGETTLAYVDGMRLKFRSDGSPGMAWYPSNAQPVGSVDDIRSRRRRVLARARRAQKREDYSHPDPFYWELRSGGYSPHRGTVPEVFVADSKVGLARRTRKPDAIDTSRADEDFAAFCRNATNAQLDGIEAKELAAGRTNEVRIVVAEKRARGLS